MKEIQGKYIRVNDWFSRGIQVKQNNNICQTNLRQNLPWKQNGVSIFLRRKKNQPTTLNVVEIDLILRQNILKINKKQKKKRQKPCDDKGNSNGVY